MYGETLKLIEVYNVCATCRVPD